MATHLTLQVGNLSKNSKEPFELFELRRAMGESSGAAADSGEQTKAAHAALMGSVSTPCLWPVRALLGADEAVSSENLTCAVRVLRRVLGRQNNPSTAGAVDMLCMGILVAVGAGCLLQEV